MRRLTSMDGSVVKSDSLNTIPANGWESDSNHALYGDLCYRQLGTLGLARNLNGRVQPIAARGALLRPGFSDKR
jgi:hypothetical protein